MIGGAANKPKADSKIPLAPGKHVVKIKNVKTGDKDGKMWWNNVLITQENEEFSHFIGCTETQYKDMAKVFKMAAEQMDALMLYDKIGEKSDYETWFQEAADLTYALIGKKIEYTVQEYNIDGNTGLWGKITGYLDVPNEAVQVVSTGKNMSAPTPSVPAATDTNDEIRF